MEKLSQKSHQMKFKPDRMLCYGECQHPGLGEESNFSGVMTHCLIDGCLIMFSMSCP